MEGKAIEGFEVIEGIKYVELGVLSHSCHDCLRPSNEDGSMDMATLSDISIRAASQLSREIYQNRRIHSDTAIYRVDRHDTAIGQLAFVEVHTTSNAISSGCGSMNGDDVIDGKVPQRPTGEITQLDVVLDIAIDFLADHICTIHLRSGRIRSTNTVPDNSRHRAPGDKLST